MHVSRLQYKALQQLKMINELMANLREKSGEFLIGCSGWNYPDGVDKGGWTGVFNPDKDTKRLCSSLEVGYCS